MYAKAERGERLVILGIDPGLARMGYGVIDAGASAYKMICYGIIETKPDIPMPQRLNIIQRGVRELIALYAPEDIAFEELFFAKNVKTALMVAAARGAAVAVASEYTENLYEYTPLQIKQAIVGYGRAEKTQIQKMVKMILKLEEIPKPDDAADGLAVAVTHANTGRSKSRFMMK